jgi:transcriptional regulator with XRE-family HTH domain
METMTTFEEKLGKLCRKRRWKQAALMKAVNERCRDDPVSKSTVSRWLNGDGKPFEQWALALARALNVPLDYLADDAQDELPRGLKPDEQSVIDVYRSMRGQGMTMEEAIDRLTLRSVEALRRLLEESERKSEVDAAFPDPTQPEWKPGSLKDQGAREARDQKGRERREGGKSSSGLDPQADVNGSDPLGKPPSPKRRR